MDIGTGIAITGLVVAAVVVPVTGFWLATRQDSVRWYREQRAVLYVDPPGRG